MKTITTTSGKYFRIQQIQIAGQWVDEKGNQTDSGNTLVSIEPTESTNTPNAEIIEGLGE